MSQHSLPCTPPPRMIEGGFISFAWVSSATKICSSKKGDFVGDIRIGTHQNVVLRHNHLTLYDPIFCPHAFNFGATLLCVGDFFQKIV